MLKVNTKMYFSMILVLTWVFVPFSNGKLSSYKQCKRRKDAGDIYSFIDCSRLGFTEFPKDPPVDATRQNVLSFYQNNIQRVPNGSFTGFQNITVLALTANKIQEIQSGAFKNLEVLRRLYLGSNKIQEIPGHALGNLKTLRVLALDDNKIQEISRLALSNLKPLRDLYLESNQIKTIKNGTFNDLHDLEELNLGYNNLKHIDSNAWDGLNNLRALGLHYQRTKGKLVLPEKMFAPFVERYRKSGKRLQLYIARTSFKCICDMYWLVHLINRGTLPDGSKFPLFKFGKRGHYEGTTCGTSDIDDTVFFESMKKKCQKSP